MAFSRATLKEYGLTAEQTDRVMALYGQSVQDKTPNSEINEIKQQAAAEALQNAPKPNPKDSEEYKALAQDFEQYKTKQSTITGAEFQTVKEKFRDTVYGMLEKGEQAKPITEQLEQIKTSYEEYFVAGEASKLNVPSFSAGTEGTMPQGYKEGSFMDAWGFLPKKGD